MFLLSKIMFHNNNYMYDVRKQKIFRQILQKKPCRYFFLFAFHIRKAQSVTSKYLLEHMRVFGCFSIYSNVSAASVFVFKNGLLPALRPSSIDRHIFPVQFCRARRIYKMRWKRRINTQASMACTRGTLLFQNLPSIPQTVARYLDTSSLFTAASKIRTYLYKRIRINHLRMVCTHRWQLYHSNRSLLDIQ